MSENNIPEAEVPEIPTTKRKELVVHTRRDIEGVLAQLINLNEDNVMHEPSCILCSNPHRKEAEKKWAKAKADERHGVVKEFFKDKCDIDMPDEVIDNHMLYHYSKGVRELQKVEYINKLRRAGSVNSTTLDKITLCFAALAERMTGINSIVPDKDTSQAEIEKIKSSETVKIVNAANSLIKFQSTLLGEMQSSGELIVLPRQSFIDIFNEIIIETRDEDKKNIITELLNRLLDLSRSAQ